MIRKENSNTRNSAIDMFRMICACMVVAVHTSPFRDIHENAGVIFCDIIIRIAVPFFFVLSGFYYMIGITANNTHTHVYKYFKRLLGEYTFWSILYFSIDFARLSPEIPTASFIRGCIFRYCIPGSHYHLWFYPALIFSLIVITVFYRCKRFKLLFLVTIPLYLAGCAVTSYAPAMERFISADILRGDYLEMFRRIVLMGLPFCTLGAGLYYCFAAENRIPFSVGKAAVIASGVLCLEHLLIYWLHLDHGVLTVSLYLLVGTIFLLLQKYPACSNSLLAFLGKNCSATVYCLHPLLIDFLKKTVEPGKTLLWILTCVISFFFAYCIFLGRKQLKFFRFHSNHL